MYVAQQGRKLYDVSYWYATFEPRDTMRDAAWMVSRNLEEAGVKHSEVYGLLQDLADGHTLTLDNGTQFRVIDMEEGK